MLKQSYYKLWNHQKAPGLISVTLIHTLNLLVTRLVSNLKCTRNTTLQTNRKFIPLSHQTKTQSHNISLLLGFWFTNLRHWTKMIVLVKFSQNQSDIAKNHPTDEYLCINLDLLSCFGKTMCDLKSIKRLK